MIFKKLFSNRQSSAMDDLIQVLGLVEQRLQDAVCSKAAFAIGAARDPSAYSGPGGVRPALAHAAADSGETHGDRSGFDVSDQFFDFSAELRGEPPAVAGAVHGRVRDRQ